MPSLDRQDRAGSEEDVLRVDIADLAEIRGDARVLEHLSRRLELRLVRGRALEVELGRLHSLRPEGSLERRHVRDLVSLDHLRELADNAAETTLRDGLGVEGGLEVLESQCVVEDVDVARRAPSAGERRCGAQEGAPTDDRANPDTRLAQERRPRVAIDLLGGFADRTVLVEHFQAWKQ
jgi:hypothetical protein